MSFESEPEFRQNWPILARVQPLDEFNHVIAMVKAGSAQEAMTLAHTHYGRLQFGVRMGTLYVHTPINA